MKQTLKFGLAIALSTLLSACGSQSNSNNAGESFSGKVLIDGSSTVFPITEAIAEEYAADQRDVKVIVNYSGTGGGFKKFVVGEIDVNNASRPIKDKEKESCQANGITYQELTVAYDGLAVIINPKNTWASTMTVAELKKLWEPAAKDVVMKWSDIRADWPSETIKLYGPGTSSGTFDYFTEAIIGEGGASRSDYSPNEDDNVLVNGIANDINAIGYFGLAYYEENQGKLQLVAIDAQKGAGPIKPTTQTVKDGSYTPLSRPLFIYASSAAVAKPQVKNFLTFYLDNAKEIAGDAGYIALPDEQYAKQKEIFNAFCKSIEAK